MPAMPSVFSSSQGVPPRGLASIRRDTNDQPQTLAAALPDGDTVGVHLRGSGGIRFLGIDTPEKTFELPAGGGRSLDSPQWEAYLTDPFQPQFGTFDIGAELKAHLLTRIGPGAGVNHRAHGDAAEQALIDLVQADMNALGQTTQNFQFFIAFSFEVFDPFGRFLAFVNRQQQDANLPTPRPLSYNERMLEKGASLPYFIWPNIDPFRAKPLLSAVIAPKTAKTIADSTPALARSRAFVKAARAAGIGVFNPADPLRFDAFEIRYLGRREPPNRAVIDLSKNDDVMLHPESYFKIPNAEDRLHIPAAFIPLFASRGWKLEGWF